ncbi:MAG: DUF4191 domain-containing protein [Actinomycetaceae bacterium]|nr:DUF4191 domain-containing protein [Actinomycetaceae bacterium]
MAKDKTPKADKPKKQRWYHTYIDAYRISKESYSWTGLAVFGSLIGGIVIGIVLAAIYGRWIVFPFTGLVTGLLAAMLILMQTVKYASYKQIDGVPGATGAVLDQIKRGWVISTEPVRFNRTQDMVFRAIGRPGIVLITDGNPGRTKRLIEDERRALKRIIPSVPISVLVVGKGEGQVPLIKLKKAMNKLPKQISHEEVYAVSNRIDAVQPNALPIPKGIDPTRVRPDRKGMRGR